MTREEQQELQDYIKRLKDAGVAELQQQYRKVFREEPRSRHRGFLWKRVAWRLQANAEGDLTERAQRRAEELANDADLRIRLNPSPPPVGEDGSKLNHRKWQCPRMFQKQT